jgi:hypothetical protein
LGNRHVTQLGRVVYDRKKHEFELKDYIRISKLFSTGSGNSQIIEVIHQIEDLMLGEMFKGDQLKAAQFLRDWIESELTRLIDKYIPATRLKVVFTSPDHKLDSTIAI